MPDPENPSIAKKQPVAIIPNAEPITFWFATYPRTLVGL